MIFMKFVHWLSEAYVLEKKSEFENPRWQKAFI